ncbi:MAG: ABC transporter permease [Gammaproteobacteria bacterium]|nr:ABC transporter permease [Gammaproteobacteria bacterium]
MPKCNPIFFKLALNSLKSRKGSVLLTLLAIIVSVYVLIGVEQIRQQTKQNFNSTIAGTDLIVGARTGDINLLLYAVFHMGAATQNISWKTYQELSSLSSVNWAVPISLGDSHQGYRVTATTPDYFKYYRYAELQPLQFEAGQAFKDVYDVVLGAEVARKLDYQLGDELVLAHGLGSTSFSLHKDKPFRVSGLLKATGTPVDRSLYISLPGMEAIHIGWNNGVNSNPTAISDAQSLTPKSVTAVMLGLKQKTATFRLQRVINEYREEALLAMLPGVTLAKLWQITSVMEHSLRLIALLILLSSLLGLVAMLLASIRERQREIAVMRVMGASPWFIFSLIEIEVMLVTFVGYVLGILSLAGSFELAKNLALEQFGLHLSANLFSLEQLIYLGFIMAAAFIAGLIPAIMAYKQALGVCLD